MAITKMKPIYTTLNTAIEYINDLDKMSTKTLEKVIDYVDNEEKNIDDLEENLTSSFECNINNAEFDFMITKQMAKQIKGDYSRTGGKDILAWHIIQSFSPEDKITPQQVHQLGKELADKFLGGNYQYIISTHLDKNHLHNHIIFNSTSFKTYKKFDVKRNVEYLKLRETNNEICKKNNLSITEYPNKKFKNSKNFIEADISKKDKTFKALLKNDIDLVVNLSINFDNFISRMQNLGYEIINDSNGLGFKTKEQKYFKRLKSLGDDYSQNKLNDIIKNNSLKNKLTPTPMKNNTIQINSVDELIEPQKVLESKISWRAKLKYCIDYYVFNSGNFDEFLQNMQEIGYSIKYGKHISFRCKGMDKNIRSKVLGENYTEEMIKFRINNENKLLPEIPVLEKKYELNQEKRPVSIKKLIDIHNNEKYKTEVYYQKFVKRYNTDQMILIDNFMRKNGYTEKSIDEVIIKLKEEISLDKKELAEIKGNFNALNKIKVNYDNQKDINKAFKNLMNIEKKLINRIKENRAKLSELNLISKNLKIYNNNQRKL